MKYTVALPVAASVVSPTGPCDTSKVVLSSPHAAVGCAESGTFCANPTPARPKTHHAAAVLSTSYSFRKNSHGKTGQVKKKTRRNLFVQPGVSFVALSGLVLCLTLRCSPRNLRDGNEI